MTATGSVLVGAGVFAALVIVGGYAVARAGKWAKGGRDPLGPTLGSLESLQSMREQGLISEEEFRKGRERVLARVAREDGAPDRGPTPSA